MASILIRNVDDRLHARLKSRAARRRRSLEEEARELLRTALAREDTPAPSLVEVARQAFGGLGDIELDLPPRSAERERPTPDFGAKRR